MKSFLEATCGVAETPRQNTFHCPAIRVNFSILEILLTRNNDDNPVFWPASKAVDKQKQSREVHWKIWSKQDSLNSSDPGYTMDALNSIEPNSEEGNDTFAISPPPTLRKMRSWPNTTKIGRKLSNDSVSHSSLHLATKQSTKYKSSLLIRCFCPIHAPKPCFTPTKTNGASCIFQLKLSNPKNGQKNHSISTWHFPIKPFQHQNCQLWVSEVFHQTCPR